MQYYHKKDVSLSHVTNIFGLNYLEQVISQHTPTYTDKCLFVLSPIESVEKFMSSKKPRPKHLNIYESVISLLHGLHYF